MNYLKNGNFHFEEDPFSKNAQGIAMIVHEDLLNNEISSKELSI